MKDYLIFKVGHEAYLIMLEYVMEVLHMVALHDVPEESIIGMMTLRNHIMPVLDLHPYLRLPDIELKIDTPIIAVNYQDAYVGLVVDEIEGVMSIHLDGEVNPDKLISRTFNLDNRILFELNLAQLIPQVTN